MEKELTGFIPDDEREQTEAERRFTEAARIVKGDAEVLVERKLIEGALDAAIFINVDKEESLRRALGRRVDPNTGIIYHLDDNPPPTDNSPLIERLVPVYDPDCPEVRDTNRIILVFWIRRGVSLTAIHSSTL